MEPALNVGRLIKLMLNLQVIKPVWIIYAPERHSMVQKVK